MTAVSQSYPNYLGGLNEQPDELKKPGQLVEALNVIPDPTTGLTRRPGFKHISNLTEADPAGTWFEIELSNQVNEDYIYFGNVRQDGKILIFSQNGEKQVVKYTEDINADLIMIMTKGEENLDLNFLGSNARKLINKSDIPVMSIRPAAKKDTSSFTIQ